MNELTAVVLNWNQPDYTIRAAGSLIGDGVPSSRIVVVDNGSTDGSWDRFTEALSSCHLVRIEQNVGFARGNNVGAAVLPGTAYLFVNSDAFVHGPGSVSRLVRALDERDAGIVVPRLLNEDLTLQRSVVPATTPAVALVHASGLSRFVPNRMRPHWSTYWNHVDSREIETANGAVFLVRGPLWNELGGFRETSFMYAEDLDLCWRARERGARVWFASEAEFVHLGGASTRWDAYGRSERVGAANAAMIRDHLSPGLATFTLGVIRTGFAARFAYRRLTRNKAAAAECAGLVRGYGARSRVADEKPISPEIMVLRPDAVVEESRSE
jgi:GT2 family glycosyltransferase